MTNTTGIERKSFLRMAIRRSNWNFGPRCAADKPGPVVAALVGTPVVDFQRPVEILRTVHSFDPCIACAVHVIDSLENQVYVVRTT